MISYDASLSRVIIDVEHCQFCGICAGVCPTSAIEIIYYDYPSLLRFVEDQKQTAGAEDLIVMCRGSIPPSVDVRNLLEDQDIRNPAQLRLPCVGRVQAEFYLQALALGMRKIVIIQCEEQFCRFQKGSAVNHRQVELLRRLMRGMGIDEDRLVLMRNTVKAVYDAGECVGCDKCEYICPEDAILARALSTPVVDFDKCTGCGACTLVCPHLAIQLKGYEYQPFSRSAQTDGIKSEPSGRRTKQSILVVCCQWAEFSGLDASNRDLDTAVRVVEIPCFNALDPALVIEALQTDFDGVLAIVCSDENCKNNSGRGTARRNVSALKRVLRNMNLAERFEVSTHSPLELTDFSSKIRGFASKIEALPETTKV